MGHLLGLFDKPWLDIPPTRQMCFHRYAEFNHVREDGVIDETAMFVDVVSIMRQAGHYPFPPATGSLHLHPGPRTHDGLLYDEYDPAEAIVTMDLVNAMIGDLLESNIVANETGRNVVNVYVPTTPNPTSLMRAPRALRRASASSSIWNGSPRRCWRLHFTETYR